MYFLCLIHQYHFRHDFPDGTNHDWQWNPPGQSGGWPHQHGCDKKGIMRPITITPTEIKKMYEYARSLSYGQKLVFDMNIQATHISDITNKETTEMYSNKICSLLGVMLKLKSRQKSEFSDGPLDDTYYSTIVVYMQILNVPLPGY